MYNKLNLSDNWASVETNWEPLYTRTAVGEERSGVWGVNTGGVWAAGPWGAATPPMISQLPSLPTESDTQVILNCANKHKNLYFSRN